MKIKNQFYPERLCIGCGGPIEPPKIFSPKQLAEWKEHYQTVIFPDTEVVCHCCHYRIMVALNPFNPVDPETAFCNCSQSELIKES